MTVVVSPGTSPESTLSLLSSLGVGPGSIYVTAVVVYLLAYLNIVEASEQYRQRLRSFLVSTSIPLVFAFIGIVIFESLTVIGYL